MVCSDCSGGCSFQSLSPNCSRSLGGVKVLEHSLNLANDPYYYLRFNPPTEDELIIMLYGMGVNGAAEARHMLDHPNRYDFDVRQVIWLTAQTGLEWSRTAYLNERYLYPRFREAGIRHVQIAKAGPYKDDGYIVLSDTRQPRKCYIRGSYTLADLCLDSGTVPQFRANRRECSDKAKGQGLELSIEHYLPGIQLEDWESDPTVDENYKPVAEDGSSYVPPDPTVVTSGDSNALPQQSYSLGEMCLEAGITPQYSNDARTCSVRSKVEICQWWLRDESREQAASWSLGQALLSNGAVPQFSPDHVRKCSDQLKITPCDQWTEQQSQGKKLTVHTIVGFQAGEEDRRDKGEFALQKKQNKKGSLIHRVNHCPQIERGWDRGRCVHEARQLANGEDWWRSACTVCPFSGISGPNEEVLEKHRRYPLESGYALFVERVSQLLNPRQTLYPDMRTLYQLIYDDGNWKAIAALEERLDRVPWAVYHVRRNYNTKMPQRHTRILATGDRYSIQLELMGIVRQTGAKLTDLPDGFIRGFVEMRSPDKVYELLEKPLTHSIKGRKGKAIRAQIIAPMLEELLTDTVEGKAVLTGFDCEELITVAPAVVAEKSRDSFEHNWTLAHQPTLF